VSAGGGVLAGHTTSTAADSWLAGHAGTWAAAGPVVVGLTFNRLEFFRGEASHERSVLVGGLLPWGGRGWHLLAVVGAARVDCGSCEGPPQPEGRCCAIRGISSTGVTEHIELQLFGEHAGFGFGLLAGQSHLTTYVSPQVTVSFGNLPRH
jgi:hypothetical protein